MNRDMITIALIALGGALGSAARHLLSTFVHRFVPPEFPYGTFVVNVAGCLAAGLLISRFEEHTLASPATRAFLFVGILGGFTTFSAFASDTFALARASQPLLALLNSGGQVVVGLLALWAGYIAGGRT